MKRLFVLVLLLFFAGLFAGCGGSKGANSSQTGDGQAVVTIRWPESTRLIPEGAAAVRVQPFDDNGNLIRDAVVDPPIVSRPPAGQGQTSTITITRLPVGQAVRFRAEAFTDASMSDAARARGEDRIVIRGDAPNTFSISMASTVADLAITATRNGQAFDYQAGTLSLGDKITLGVTAKDKDSATVLVADSKITWRSTNTGDLSLNGVRAPASGSPVTVRGYRDNVNVPLTVEYSEANLSKVATLRFEDILPPVSYLDRTVGSGGTDIEDDIIRDIVVGAGYGTTGDIVYVLKQRYDSFDPRIRRQRIEGWRVDGFPDAPMAVSWNIDVVLPPNVRVGAYTSIARNQTGLAVANNGIYQPDSPQPPINGPPFVCTFRFDGPPWVSPVTFTNIADIDAADGYTYVLDNGHPFSATEQHVVVLDDRDGHEIRRVTLPSVYRFRNISVDDEGSIFLSKGAPDGVSDNTVSFFVKLDKNGVSQALEPQGSFSNILDIDVDNGTLSVMDGRNIRVFGLTGVEVSAFQVLSNDNFRPDRLSSYNGVTAVLGTFTGSFPRPDTGNIDRIQLIR